MDWTIAGLLVWGVVVGLDLIAVPQVMVARPLVAGTVAGWLSGDIWSGASVGIVMEMFALEVLPFGGARYADYGIGAVAGAAAASGAPGLIGLGPAIALGLLVAYAGELSIQIVRRRNSGDVARHQAAIESGDAAVVAGVHLRGIAREATRALILIGAGLALAHMFRGPGLVSVRGAILAGAAVIATALAAGVGSAWSLSRSVAGGIGWLGAGVAAGVVWVILR